MSACWITRFTDIEDEVPIRPQPTALARRTLPPTRRLPGTSFRRIARDHGQQLTYLPNFCGLSNMHCLESESRTESSISLNRSSEQGKVRVTGSARVGAAAWGLELADMLTVLMALTPADFHKSMTTHADHTIWQDVYRPSTPASDVDVAQEPRQT